MNEAVILRESLHHEAESLKAYKELLALAKEQNVRLEEYARDIIATEMAHQDEVDKLLRNPGQTEAFSAPLHRAASRARSSPALSSRAISHPAHLARTSRSATA